MNLNEHLRQTGRTERLLKQAVTLSQQGRKVYVLCATEQMARELDRTRFSEYRRHVPLGQVEFIRIPPNFNWETMRLANTSYDYGVVYLADHHLAEQEVQRLQSKITHFELLKLQIYQMTL